MPAPPDPPQITPSGPNQQEVRDADNDMGDAQADDSLDYEEEEFGADELEDSGKDPITEIKSWASAVALQRGKENIFLQVRHAQSPDDKLPPLVDFL
ncbi:hypothetical protein FRB94_009448 [Tulasnella sp. JGI-2019a]|nr:hypothetical protein FRB93_008539 [Tulasnella sp. JGI-2019a]KAG8995104.1 hypothetical protein FRB94_009448 [Tulasnella sp. JGI-2019a]KAG9025803.1 hypothetical protein FRB95_009777 [Tulasnella sp. JGI-2019a]